MEAPSSAGELEMDVMKYVRSTCERGSTESPDISAGEDGEDEEVEEVELEMDDCDSVAGFSIGGVVCILRRLDCLRLPCCATQT